MRRPDRTLATADHNVPTDGTPVAARIRDELSRKQVETLERNCEEFGIPLYSLGLRPAGDRARHRARAGRHPAGHDDRLRRLAHRHARRVRRARVRDRHERGRARAGHAVPGPVQAPVDADPLRGLARVRRHGQGPDPGHDRPDGRRRRRRPRRRVRRAGDRGAVDGGPDDRLQHDDRGRRPRRDDRSRRDDVRMGDRPAGARRRRCRTSGASCSTDDGATFDKRDRGRRRRRSARWSPGARRPGWSSPVTDAVPEPRLRAGRARARVHGARAGHADRRRSSSTACSSARARTRGSAICARRPRSWAAARSPTASTRWSSRARSRSRRRPSSEGLDEVFKRAGFDWRGAGLLDVPGHEPRHRGARRARRVDLEPQLRGPPGPRRPLAPGLAADGRRGGDRGALRGHPRLGGRTDR